MTDHEHACIVDSLTLLRDGDVESAIVILGNLVAPETITSEIRDKDELSYRSLDHQLDTYDLGQVWDDAG